MSYLNRYSYFSTSQTVVSYRRRFRHDVIKLALVVIFNIQKNIGLKLWADVFQISQQRQAVIVTCNTL